MTSPRKPLRFEKLSDLINTYYSVYTASTALFNVD